MQEQRTAIKFLVEFFAHLNNNNIRYVVLRGYQNLPDRATNDIDIFIESPDFIIVENRLLEFGDNFQVCSVVSHFGIKKYIVRCANNIFVTIDLFNAISWKGFLFADSSAIIKNTTQFNGITVSLEGVEAAIVILKELLMSGKVKSRNNAKERIFDCLKCDEQSFSVALQKYLGPDKTSWLKEQVMARNWKEIEEKTNTLRRTVIARNLWLSIPRTFINFFSWLILRLKDKFCNKRGVFAAIIGPDGSGKTTLVNIVNSELSGSLFCETHHYASNFQILPLLSDIAKHLTGKKEKKTSRSASQFQGFHSGMKQEVNSPLRSCIYIIWYSFDLLIGRIVLWKKKSKGELVFFARYFYDYYYQRSNQNAPHLLLDFFHLVIPKPDIVFYIDRDAENIYSSKPELSVSEIKRQQQIIIKLSQKYDNFFQISANQGIDSSKDQIVDALANLLARRVK